MGLLLMEDTESSTQSRGEKETSDPALQNEDEWDDEIDPLFDHEEKIWANREILRIGHVPGKDRIVGRDDELKAVADQLQGVVRGQSPDHTVIFGKTGTGKSLVSRHVADRAKRAAQGLAVGSVYIDCAEDNTETQAVSQMARELNDPDETDIDIPIAGLSTSRYYKLLWEILDIRFDAAIIILDEVDMMKDDSILMKLSRAEEAGKIDCRLGIIAISNKLRYTDNLDKRVQSSFQHKELYFEPYDSFQLKDIMERRIDAFKDGAVDDGVLELAAGLGAKEHGDARKAIDILRNAGDIANKQGNTQITEEYVRKAQKKAEEDRFRDAIGSSTNHEKATLAALALLTTENETDVFKSGTVYERYSQICNSSNLDPLSSRRVRDILDEMAFLEICESWKKGKAQDGVHRMHRLLEDPEIVLRVVYSDTRFS
jgi:cell division control protein 6